MATPPKLETKRTLFAPFELLSIFLLTHLAITLPTNGTDDISPLSNDALSDSMLGAPVASCATLPQWPEWFQPSEKFDFGDVEMTLDLFFDDYVRDHGIMKYEFLKSGVRPVHGIPTQRLPLKVARGTCYVVIAMRSQFKEGELPAETSSLSAGSDISSFEQIYRGLLSINSKCARKGNPGWYPTGDLNSIAVFIWQAASPINQRIHFGSGIIEEGFNQTSLLEFTAGNFKNISTS